MPTGRLCLSSLRLCRNEEHFQVLPGNEILEGFWFPNKSSALRYGVHTSVLTCIFVASTRTLVALTRILVALTRILVASTRTLVASTCKK